MVLVHCLGQKGATYDIFKGLDGVTVNDDNTITVGKADADVSSIC